MEKLAQLKYLFIFVAITGLVLTNNYASAAQSNIEITPPDSKNTDNQIVITGRVVDDSNEPLMGVTVRQGKNGPITATNIDGKYSITLSNKASQSLTFTYVGMKSLTEQINGRTNINVTLEFNAVALDDVVVVGAYGTAQKREDLVGSMYQVNSEDLLNLPQQRIDAMLDGLYRVCP